MPKDTQFNPYWKNLIDFFFDKDTDWKPKVAMAFALIYLLWPLDLIPDLAPILGWLDDIGITALAIAYLGYAVKKYLNKSTETTAEQVTKAIQHKSMIEKHRAESDLPPSEEAGFANQESPSDDIEPENS